MSELNIYIIEFLKILSDDTRLRILTLLKAGEKTQDEIVTTLNKRQSTISQQLKTLQSANLIEAEKKDRNYYRIKDPFVFKVLASIQSLVINLNKEKVKALTNLDIIDTLL